MYNFSFKVVYVYLQRPSTMILLFKSFFLQYFYKKNWNLLYSRFTKPNIFTVSYTSFSRRLLFNKYNRKFLIRKVFLPNNNLRDESMKIPKKCLQFIFEPLYFVDDLEQFQICKKFSVEEIKNKLISEMLIM